MHDGRTVTDRLDRATPLQRAILGILGDGGSRTPAEVFTRLDLFTPASVTDAHRDAVAFAVERALCRLVDEGLADEAAPSKFRISPATASAVAH